MTAVLTVFGQQRKVGCQKNKMPGKIWYSFARLLPVGKELGSLAHSRQRPVEVTYWLLSEGHDYRARPASHKALLQLGLHFSDLFKNL